MRATTRYLSPTEAARELGISAKALRLYEERGLLKPSRTISGWRAYGAEDMARAREIATLRALGLSLAQVADVMLNRSTRALAQALAAHQAQLESDVRCSTERIGKVRALRAALDCGQTPTADQLVGLTHAAARSIAFDLPWPWGGERFELNDIRPLTFIVGPLFSGKTRLAHAIAAALPGGVFVGLDRLTDHDTGERMAADPSLNDRVERALGWLVGEGATVSPALVSLVTALEAAEPTVLVVDLVEQGLDQATQEALTAHLRRRRPDAPPLFLLTRSNAILDLTAVRPHEAILFCPANHAPPSLVQPFPGAPGYEAVATCLGSPEVRARTEGVIAIRTSV